MEEIKFVRAADIKQITKEARVKLDKETVVKFINKTILVRANEGKSEAKIDFYKKDLPIINLLKKELWDSGFSVSIESAFIHSESELMLIINW